MKPPRFRAVILAAGLGSRLRPLTLAVPKPLLPVAGLPVLGHTLTSLKKAGCESVAINLHYQGEKIASRFGDDFDGMPIHYSREEEILGTLGALGPLADFLSDAELVVVINGDSLARWPLAKLLRHHQEHTPRATLLFSSRARAEAFGGGVAINREGRVVSFTPTPSTEEGQVERSRRRVFAGAHVFSPDILLELSRGPSDGPSDFVRELYQPAVERGERIDGVESSSLWFDLGTPQRYLEGVLGWAGAGGWRRRGWWDSEAEVVDEASVKRSVLEAGARVETEARVRRSLVLSGARIGKGSRVTDSIVGFSVELPAGTVIEGRLVTEARANVPPGPDASVVGGLVYSPLESQQRS